MIKQIWLLSKIRLCNIFKFNEARFGKNSKNKKSFIFTLVSMLILIAIGVLYMSMFCIAFLKIGLQDVVIDLALISATSAVFLYSIVIGGGSLFNLRAYEREVALPVNKIAIVISRFAILYIYNVIIEAVIVLPCIVIYAIYVVPSFLYYINFLIVMLFLPLVPLAVSGIISTLITMVTSRFKYRNMLRVLISLVIVVAILIFSFSMPSTVADETALIENFASAMKNVTDSYFMTSLGSSAITEYNVLNLIAFVGISVAVIIAFVVLSSLNYGWICSALMSYNAKQNFVMSKQKSSSIIITLFKNEIKRYFASSSYVMNTIIGFILVLIVSIAVPFVGVNQVVAYIGIVEAKNVGLLLAFIVSFCYALAPITTSQISIEGKSWWLKKTLPISMESLVISKLMLTYVLALPVWVISTTVLLFSLGLSFVDALILILVPLSYIAFSSTLGLFVNLKMHRFNWENEIEIVKRGAPTGVCMIIGMLTTMIPLALIMVIPNVMQIASFVIMGILFICAVIFFMLSTKVKIIDIE